MNTTHSNSRRVSFNTTVSRRSSSNVPKSMADLNLVRTHSNELSVVETVAVPEHQGLKSSYKDDDEGVKDNTAATMTRSWGASTRYVIMLVVFLTSTSFGVTQVPLLYAFRLMSCDIYYQTHPDTPPAVVPADRCSVRSIESSTALNVAILGASTTVFGTFNLFLTGNLIQRLGLQRTLVIQVGFPAVRLLIQNIGIEVWGSIGIVIVQCSQIASIIGGPSGYVLCCNSFITEIVGYEERTAWLGRVAGSMMFGSATGFLIGGIVAEHLGIKAPFRLTLALFLSSCVLVSILLPNIPPPKPKDGGNHDKPKAGRLRRTFGPLLVFAPKQFAMPDGVVRKEYGTLLLACGVFTGILATGYLPTLLQLYSTDVFHFGTQANGALIFVYSLLRGCFLTFVFPQLIALGRSITAKRQAKALQKAGSGESEASERDPLLATDATNSAPEEETTKDTPKERTFAFDLIYARMSLLADGLLTLLCAFTRSGTQLYAVACVLPFSAGTGSAAKGTVLQMVGAHASSAERTDALAGLSLVENMARLSTTFVFGVIFASLASIGRPGLTFVCNAAVAILGFCVLLFARFPPDGSHRVDPDQEGGSQESD